MEDLKQRVLAIAHEIHPQIVEFRRHFHAFPELSMQEFETARFITKQLQLMGIKYRSGIAKTGIIATIEGINPDKKLVALRADMDALPINEINDAIYKSQNPGVMHACGHDAHMASLLGTTMILNRLKDKWEGSVRLIFQPSEETYPGGASLMIKEGVLENPKPDCIIGQHVCPGLPAGKVGFRAGLSMASTDEIYITIKGKGGHGATPELNADPVVAAAHVLIALQQIVSRKTPPLIPTVLSFGRFIADGKMNIIPNEAKLEGTIRTYDENWRKNAHVLINEIAGKTAEAFGVTADIHIAHGYPSLLNDKLLTERAMHYAAELIGEENSLEIPQRLTAEDFAFYSHIIPACFYRLGISKSAKGIIANLHTPEFDIDEEALLTGSALMAWITMKELQQ